MCRNVDVIARSQCPIVIAHGAWDLSCPLSDAFRLYNAAIQGHRDVQLHVRWWGAHYMFLRRAAEKWGRRRTPTAFAVDDATASKGDIPAASSSASQSASSDGAIVIVA